jgi:hypothetical protein
MISKSCQEGVGWSPTRVIGGGSDVGGVSESKYTVKQGRNEGALKLV